MDPSGHWEIGDEKLSKSAQKKIKKSIKKDSKNNKYIDAETWKQVSRETSRQTRGEAQYAQKAAVNVISYIEKEVGLVGDYQADIEKHTVRFRGSYLNVLKTTNGIIDSIFGTDKKEPHLQIKEIKIPLVSMHLEGEIKGRSEIYHSIFDSIIEGTSDVEQSIIDNGIAVNDIDNRPKQIEFLNSILHGAVSKYLRTGISWQVTMAQAAQETGWGDKEIIDMYSGKSSNNLFGIKYYGSESNTDEYALTWTTEYISSSDLGYWKSEQAKWAQEGEALIQTGKTNSKDEIQIKVIQPFSVYSSKDDSIIANSQTLGNGRYDDAMQYKDDPYAFIDAIAGTYATDDSYASSISSIMTKYLTWDGK